jgi:3-hydroxypropanoate dehydrogenase
MSETMTAQSADDAALDLLFRAARTHNTWRDRPVEEATLRAIHDLMRWGPTSANCSPARIVFCRSPEAKARLRPFLTPGNVEKTMAAPVCAILAYDSLFYEKLDQLFPQNPAMKDYFARDPEQSARHALRNASLQGGYFILAARALGLDCGPMSGFDTAGLDREFFPDGRWKSNFLCNLGYGDPVGLRPRNPRLDFDDACRIV